MPSANTSLHERALRRAHAHESVELSWGDLVFGATKNATQKPLDAVDPNDSDDTGCTLTAVVSADPSPAEPDGFLHADHLPAPGDTFTDAAGRKYRVARRDYTPGHPKIVLHVPNVIA